MLVILAIKRLRPEDCKPNAILSPFLGYKEQITTVEEYILRTNVEGPGSIPRATEIKKI